LYKVKWWIGKLNEEAKEKENQRKNIEGSISSPVYPNVIKHS